MPTDTAEASCFVQIVDQRVCELTGRVHTASMRLPLRMANVSVQPVLCRLADNAALIRVDYALDVLDSEGGHVLSFAISLAVVVQVAAGATEGQLRELAAGPMLYHLHNELRVELDNWTQRMGLPRLVIDVMAAAQVREASLAALAGAT